MEDQAKVMQTSVGKTCPYCQYPIKPGVSVTTCEKCGIPHHADCWDHNRGCTTFGCTGASAHSMHSQSVTTAPSVIDLSNTMNEPEPTRMVLPSFLRRNEPTGSEHSLRTRSRKIEQIAGIIGGILGFAVGLNVGVPGCFLFAWICYVVGSMMGVTLIYLLVIGICVVIGSNLLLPLGGEGVLSGGIFGLAVGIVLVAIVHRKINGDGNGG